MVYEYVALVFLIAWLKKGSFNQLSETKIKAQGLIIFCLFLQLFIVYAGPYLPFINQTFTYWIILSYILLLGGSLVNHQLAGFKLFAFGLLLNFIVIVANSGRMPVSADALTKAGMAEDISLLAEGHKKHEILSEQTLLPILADVIPMTSPFVIMNIVVSIGDLIMTLGICWFIYRHMTKSSTSFQPLNKLTKSKA